MGTTTLYLYKRTSIYCKKKVSDIPFTSRDVTYRTLPGPTRVSFKTSFDSKQLKLEPKLVSALSETKRLFRLFRFYTETESFDVAVETKQTEDQPIQLDSEHILIFLSKNLGFFRFVSVCFG